jgi:integrase
MYCFSPRESEAKRRAERQAARKTPLSCGNVPGSNRVRHKPKRRAGVRYTTQSYASAVRRACDKAFPVPAGIADNPTAVEKWRADHHWFPNQLRHTVGTVIRKRFGLEAAQTVLGHSKADVTQVYAERDLRMAAEVISQIG